VSRLGSSVFISEYGNTCISEFNQSDGAFVRVLDTSTMPPFGICLSPDETTLAVACPDRHCIMMFRVDGSEAPSTIGGEMGSGDGQLYFPHDARFTPDGQQLVVADRKNHRVQVLNVDGSFVRKIPLGNIACAVAVDMAGNIIATTDNHVKVFSPKGTLLHDELGGLKMGDAATGGLAIDSVNGRIAAGDKGFWHFSGTVQSFVQHASGYSIVFNGIFRSRCFVAAIDMLRNCENDKVCVPRCSGTVTSLTYHSVFTIGRTNGGRFHNCMCADGMYTLYRIGAGPVSYRSVF
jgi:DNA-binding beta-propeller fold protein YncE